MDNKKVYGVTFEVVEYDTLQFAKVEVTNKMEVINAVLNYCLAYNLRIKKFISIKNYRE